MSEQADISVVRTFLERVVSRLVAVAATEGAAAGLVVAALVIGVRLVSSAGALALVVLTGSAMALGIVARLLWSRNPRRQRAQTVEHAAGNCHNLVVAADELITHPERRGVVAPLVFRQAASAVQRLDTRELFPVKRAVWLLLASGTMLASAIVLTTRQVAITDTVAGASTGAAMSAPTLSRIDVSVRAPAYVTRAVQTLRDPTRIDALAGSTIQLTVQSNATAIVVETIKGADSLVASGNGKFSGTVLAQADGFIALSPITAAGPGVRKLIGLTVTQDRTPRVRITAPAQDMMFPDGNRKLAINIEADDDLALSTLRLRYTKVSGSGERFTFTEGEVPLQLSRTSDQTWKAHVNWNLSPLALDAGDMVVYRAAATDRRPGAPVAESDSYIAEIKMVGSDAAAGFAIDPDQDRYALSQQMIILKTERLIARRGSLDAEAFANEAREIGAEQRRVRAEFVFMMGGELEDAPAPDADMTTLNETAEAEGEADIMDGRGANLGRIALQRAVRSMSGAVMQLNESNVAAALVTERVALTQLERAFSHTRIILRALTQQERLDLTRRMTGPLLEAGRTVSPVPAPESSSRVLALRAVLASVAELSSGARAVPASTRASEMAERVLRVDPGDKSLQEIAGYLNDAAAAFGNRQDNVASQSLDRAAVALTASLRIDLPAAPIMRGSPASNRLQGALNDALREARQGGQSAAPRSSRRNR